MFIQIKNAEELLQKLGKIPGSQAAHGEVSFGYSFELKDGSKLIIGQTDTDVSEEHLFWIQLINKPVEITKEQPEIQKGLHFDQDELEPLYHLLNTTNGRKYMDELDVFLERIAFCLKG